MQCLGASFEIGLTRVCSRHYKSSWLPELEADKQTNKQQNFASENHPRGGRLVLWRCVNFAKISLEKKWPKIDEREKERKRTGGPLRLVRLLIETRGRVENLASTVRLSGSAAHRAAHLRRARRSSRSAGASCCFCCCCCCWCVRVPLAGRRGELGRGARKALLLEARATQRDEISSLICR